LGTWRLLFPVAKLILKSVTEEDENATQNKWPTGRIIRVERFSRLATTTTVNSGTDDVFWGKCNTA